MTRIQKSSQQKTLSQIIQEYERGYLIIPSHQREYRWTLKDKCNYIKSILKGYPIPAVILNENDNEKEHKTIEDGRHRIDTAAQYRRNEFAVIWDDKYVTYSQLSDQERFWYDHEPLVAIITTNASPKERIEIFLGLQCGQPLTSGDKYHSCTSLSPLVTFSKEIMTQGSPYHDNFIPHFGERWDTSKDIKRASLLNYVAIAKGLAFGPEYATKQFDDELITKEIDNAAICADLNRLLEILNLVNEAIPIDKKWFKDKQFEVGCFIGPILYSLSIHARNVGCIDGYKPNSLKNSPKEWEKIKMTWVTYLIKLRKALGPIEKSTKTKFCEILNSTIHKNVPDSRNWGIGRWDACYKTVFEIE